MIGSQTFPKGNLQRNEYENVNRYAKEKEKEKRERGKIRKREKGRERKRGRLLKISCT